MMEENARFFIDALLSRKEQTKQTAKQILRAQTHDLAGKDTAIQVASKETGLPVRVVWLGSMQQVSVMNGLLLLNPK